MARRFFQSDYWRLSRNSAVGFLFITPLWLVYEILTFKLNNGWLGELRTGVDVLIKALLSKFAIHAGLAVIIPAFFLLWLMIQQKKSVIRFIKKPTRFAFMFLESLLYALFFGLAVGFATSIFLSSASGVDKAKIATLVVHIGSGVYEETLFRFALITLFVMGLEYLFKLHPNLNYIIAIVISSLIFAYCHYLKIFNEPLELQSFIFRFLAGAVFSVLFILRGVGIAAYTHSLYNILLMFRQ